MGYTKKMELIINMNNMKKNELLDKCKELGITKCNSKNKTQLIEIINNHTNLIHPIPIFNDLILDAENIEKGAIAKLHLKHHIPYGLHGSFTPEIFI